jgi:hypothetical protein
MTEKREYPCRHLDYETEYKLHLDEMVCRCGARRRLYGPDQHWRRDGRGWRTAKREFANDMTATDRVDGGTGPTWRGVERRGQPYAGPDRRVGLERRACAHDRRWDAERGRRYRLADRRKRVVG